MARLFNRKGGRHAYVDDYKMDESGSYTWQGDRWQFAVPEQRTPLIRLMWICHLLAAAVMIGAGCIPAPGVDHVPYIQQHVPGLAALFGEGFHARACV